MTNLYPGLLFFSTGLNKKSTPLPPHATPSEIDTKLARAPFNGKPWPKSSPVSAVYDVRNSSTRMIILNNKLKRAKASHLRGQTEIQGEIQSPEPSRHMPVEPKTNHEHHRQCTVSTSEKFVPILPRGASPAPEWVNKTQRPAMRFDNGSSVNPNHHIQCQGTTEYMQLLRWYDAQRKRPRERTPSVRENRAMSPIMQDRQLSRGEKRYLSSIARIYSVQDMKMLKQSQYNALMWKEINKGTYKESDWNKYNRYLNTPRKTQFGPCDPNRQKRSISAPSQRKPSPSRSSEPESKDDERPQTTPNKPSKGPACRGDTKGGKPSGSTKGRAKKGAPQPRRLDTLVGKPARVESPLPPMPKVDSKTSLSSLDEDTEKSKSENQRAKDEGGREDEMKDKHEEKAKEDTKAQREEEEEKRAGGGDIAVQEVQSGEEGGEEDERSKMSARDWDEQRGDAVEYRPTESERMGEGELRSPDEREPSYAVKTSARKEEQDNAQSPVSTPPREAASPQETKQEESKSPNPLKQDGAGQKEESKKPEVKMEVKEASDEEQKVSDDDTAANRDDGFEGSPELIHHVHKEGKDRPMSRIGGREQFMVITKKDAENSDDDYSDDEDVGSNRGDNKEDQVRGDNANDTKGSNLEDSRAMDDREGLDSPQTPNNSKDFRGAGEESNNHDQFEMKLKALPDDSVSQDGSPKPAKDATERKDQVTPTEASSQEKPSEISTLEY